MNKTKRIFSLFLALLLVFTLAACGNPNNENKDTQAEKDTTTEGEKDTTSEGEKDTTSEGEKKFAGKTLKLAGLEGGYGIEGWNKVIAGFEALTGAKVDAQFAKNIEEEVRPQIQAGTPADVFYISVGRQDGLTETMLKEKAVLDISDVFTMKVPGEDKVVKDKMMTGILDTFTTNPYGDGKTYLAPIFYSPTGLFYNADLFGEGKLTLPTTIDEMNELKGKVEGAHVFTYPIAGYFDQVFYGLVNTIGGKDLFDKLMSYDVEAWKNEAKPVFEAMGNLVKDTNPNTVSQANKEGFTKNQLSVMKNESLFMPNGTWIVGEMKDAQGVADGFKWGFMALPSIEKGKDRYAYTFTEQVWVSANTKEPELAKEFIAYLYSDEATKLFIENGGAVMPIQDSAKLITDENQKLFYAVYENGAKAASGTFQSAPSVPGVDLNKTLFGSLDSVVNGDMTVEQWHQATVDAVTKISEAMNAQ